MGYVLPIDQYVYQAYHNRVIGQEVEHLNWTNLNLSHRLKESITLVNRLTGISLANLKKMKVS